jgi:hypothetical protein
VRGEGVGAVVNPTQYHDRVRQDRFMSGETHGVPTVADAAALLRKVADIIEADAGGPLPDIELVFTLDSNPTERGPGKVKWKLEVHRALSGEAYLK